MNVDKLKIQSIEKKNPSLLPENPILRYALQAQAKMERLLYEEPDFLDVHKCCLQTLRIQRTLKAITLKMSLKGKRIADLGAGGGELTHLLSMEGAFVDATDVATNALKYMQERNILKAKIIHDCLPHSKLQDSTYDVVICADVIADMPLNTHRILMSDLARMVKADGFIILSTELDFSTDYPLEHFENLAGTEFTIKECITCYHKLFIQCLKVLNYLPLTRKLAKLLRQSHVINFFEKMSRLIWGDKAISHAILICKRRML